MEKQIEAFFYKYKYYVLPHGCDCKELSCGTVVAAKRLKEVKCMAPDFVYDSIEEEMLEIDDPGLLFPVYVNLYSSNEYDDLLDRQTDRICRGCLNFIDDDSGPEEELYRELSLDGVCYLRETERVVSLELRILWFYGDLKERLDELAECIENGDGEKLNDICMECAKYIAAPVKFYGCKHEGKYRLYWQAGFGSDLDYTVLRLTAEAAKDSENPLTAAGWEVLPYVPENLLEYSGNISGDLPAAYLTQSEVPWRYYVEIYSETPVDKEREAQLMSDFHHYLSCAVGEDLVLNAVEGYRITDEKSRLSTPSEICDALKKRADEWEGYGFPPLVSYSWEDVGTLPYRRTASGSTVCYTLAAIGTDVDSAEVYFDNGFAFAYIYVPVTLDKIENTFNVLSFYFNHADQIPEPIAKKDDFLISFIQTGYCECSDGGENSVGGLAFDFLVADKKQFYRFIKSLSPVLKSYGARLVTVNEEGVNEYVCDYEILPVANDENN